MKNVLVLLSACGLLLSIAFVSAEEKKEEKKAVKKIDLKDIKCPVSGMAVKEDKHLAYKGAQVFFCCENCPKAFEKEIKTNAKFQTAANEQLVATKQAKQVKCPITGKDIDATKTEKVDGVTVAFCCGNCKAAVAKAEGAEKTAMVFSDAAFTKGFKVRDAKKDGTKKAKGDRKKNKDE